MTVQEFADALRRIADALEKFDREKEVGLKKPILNGDFAIGAAALWGYLRDLVTVSGKDRWTRDELLVALDTINRDPELCLPNTFYQFAELQKSDGEVG